MVIPVTVEQDLEAEVIVVAFPTSGASAIDSTVKTVTAFTAIAIALAFRTAFLAIAALLLPFEISFQLFNFLLHVTGMLKLVAFLPCYSAQVAHRMATLRTHYPLLAFGHVDFMLARRTLSVLEGIVHQLRFKGVLAISRMFHLQASLADVLPFLHPEDVLVLEKLDLDGVRQVFVDWAGQGHHLVTVLVGADDNGEALDLADSVGVQAGVAIVM